MFTIDTYLPTRIIFGCGRLDELKTITLPGKHALLCISGNSIRQSGTLARVENLLQENHTDYTIFDKITPNPTKKCVEEATQTAKENNCDFVIGLGGGSSIDTAKAAAIMMKSEGDLWDYGYTGTGGQKDIPDAAPVVTITTTCGTGTESDSFCVITNEATQEKLDFASDAIFPVISIIDPELMVSLPRSLTIFQGFDALFHAAECYVANGHQNKFVDLYSLESVKTICHNLPLVVENPDNLEARSNMAYAADILSGYTMALVSVTSHHILAQTLGGMYETFPHGATLIATAEAYYSKACSYLPDEFDELGEIMGVPRDPEKPGYAFVRALVALMQKTDSRYLKMSDYGVKTEDFDKIVHMTTHQVGVDLDRYHLSDDDFYNILQQSYR